MDQRALFVTVVASSLATLATAQVPFKRTFLGGSGYERVQGVTVDSQGRVYVAGHTSSNGLHTTLPPSAGGFDTNWNGNLDGFVAVLSPDLKEVLHWTFIGGSGEDRAYQVEIDPQGLVVVVGLSDSTDLPFTTGGNHGDWDAFVVRLTPDLQNVVTCSTVGGSADENPRGSFAIDSSGNVYIAGHTGSLDFPATPGAYQTVHGPVNPDPWDGFVAKVDPAGQVVWATMLGGSKNDSAHSGCRIAADGSVFVAGMTNSDDFPTTPGSFQSQFGGHDAVPDPFIGDGFVARLSADGSQLVFSTFLGGSNNDSVAGNDALELDLSGDPVVVGLSWSGDFPMTPGTFDTSFGGAITHKGDAFVAKLSADGSHLISATYLGGEQGEEPSGLAVGPQGEVFLSGNTESANFPVTPDASQYNAPGGLRDAFLAKLSRDFHYLDYSTYIGGTGQVGQGDRGRGLTLLSNGDVLVGGDTDSPNFPVSPAGTFDASYNGGPGDGWIDIESLSVSYAFGQGKITSLGTDPQLKKLGNPSPTGAGFSLRVSDGVPSTFGFLAYGHYLVELPYQGGIRYMGPPVTRVPGVVSLDATGAAVRSVPISPDMVGETRVYQLWFRDPTHPDGTRAGLTNALKVTFVP